MGYPLINNAVVGWAELSIDIPIAGGDIVRTKGISAISWGDALSGAAVQGVGPDVLGSTIGTYSANGSITMYLKDWKVFRDALNSINPKIGTVFFSVNLAWSPLDEDGATADDVMKATLLGCRIMGRTHDSAPGGDAASIVLPLFVTKVEEDGVSLV